MCNVRFAATDYCRRHRQAKALDHWHAQGLQIVPLTALPTSIGKVTKTGRKALILET
jgi:hypothetical protein